MQVASRPDATPIAACTYPLALKMSWLSETGNSELA